jgi:hypothetical protein
MHWTGAPKSVALGSPSRCARRRPVNAIVWVPGIRMSSVSARLLTC